MTELLVLHVEGVPQPQGSAKAFRRGAHVIVTSDNPRLGSWRDLIGWTLRQQRDRPMVRPRGHALRVQAEFALPRPKSRAKALHHTVKPDLDKLVRAVGDALENLVYQQDSQIVAWDVRKRYIDAGEVPGVVIRVSEVS